MPRRTFVMKDGKPQIKAIEGRISFVPLGSAEEKIFRADMISMVENHVCSFMREYIPGEYNGFKLPRDLDLNEITHTYVLIGHVEEHVLAHLEPIGDTYKIVVFDMEGKNPLLARVPLLPEQAEIIRQDLENGASL